MPEIVEQYPLLGKTCAALTHANQSDSASDADIRLNTRDLQSIRLDKAIHLDGKRSRGSLGVSYRWRDIDAVSFRIAR
jgi:hypothetical protein